MEGGLTSYFLISEVIKMGKEVFVGIDLGTTGIKVIFMDAAGKVLASDSTEYDILNPESDYAEQKPSDWWSGLCQMSNNILEDRPELKSRIAGIGIAGQMHTQVYLDQKDNILRNAITWMDQRTQNIVEEINQDEEKKELIFEKTANFLTTTYTAPHIVWVKQNQPEIYEQTENILLAKDYLKYRLTGEMVTDYSDAAGTLLFNTKEKEWSADLFNLFELNQDLMPPVDKSSAVIGEITEQAAEATGLPSGTPVINGSADHAATSLGAGVINPGEVTAIVGTAGVVSVVSDEPLGDSEERVFCWNYCLEDKWVNLAPMQTAGEALNWFKRTFDAENEDAFANYNQEITEVPDGSDGLLFLPYLMGERAPIWDSDARGVFFGIGMDHTKYHFVKSIMEGVSFAFKQNVEIIESLGINVEELRMLGGGSQSEEWIKIMSKILNKKITPVQGQETGALGTSILCGLGLDIYDSVENAVDRLTETGEEYYYEDLPHVYADNYNKYKELYTNNQQLFKE